LVDLTALGGIFLTFVVSIFILRLAYFKKSFVTLLDCICQRITEIYNEFEKAVYSNERDPLKILNLAALYDAWKDNERKIEKGYKLNKKYTKFDLISLIPCGIVILFGSIEFDGVHVYRAIVFLIVLPFISYVVYSIVKSYRLENTMEDKLGIGKPRSININVLLI
jgi:hypothetical protein